MAKYSLIWRNYVRGFAGQGVGNGGKTNVGAPIASICSGLTSFCPKTKKIKDIGRLLDLTTELSYYNAVHVMRYPNVSPGRELRFKSAITPENSGSIRSISIRIAIPEFTWPGIYRVKLHFFSSTLYPLASLDPYSDFRQYIEPTNVVFWPMWRPEMTVSDRLGRPRKLYLFSVPRPAICSFIDLE